MEEALEKGGVFADVNKKNQCPEACIMAGETPCLARAVAPPALIDWPATSFLKKRRRRVMKKEQVGIVLASVSQRGR